MNYFDSNVENNDLNNPDQKKTANEKAHSNILLEYTKKQKKFIEAEKNDLTNLFGIVPQKYVRYFNIIVIEVAATLFFTIIYYILLIDYEKNFFVPNAVSYTKGHFENHKWAIALFMSINFQSTTAFVDLKCKSIISRTIINCQLVSSFLIAFYFLTTQ